MSNGFPHEMGPKHYEALNNLSIEVRAEKLGQIIELYSNYVRDCRLLREALYNDIEEIIFGSDQP